MDWTKDPRYLRLTEHRECVQCHNAVYLKYKDTFTELSTSNGKRYIHKKCQQKGTDVSKHLQYPCGSLGEAV